MRVEGYNGQVELNDDELVVARQGFVARAAFGKDTPERHVPLLAVRGVRLKEATRLKNGWLELLLGDQEAPELSAGTAGSNANAVLFRHKDNSKFRELRDKLEAIVELNVQAGIDPSQVEWDQIGGQQGRFDKRAAQVSEEGAKAPAASQQQAEKIRERQAKAEAAGLRPDIAEASARMGWTFGGKREIKNLEEHLHDGERVSFLAQGRYEDNQGIVALTEERLLFVFHGLTRQSVQDFALDRVTSVQTKAGIGSGDLTVESYGHSAVIKSIIKSDLKFLADALRQRIAMREAPTPPTPAAPVDVADQLEKLANLLDRGALSQEEFDAQKAKLLG
jgi:hypothetical protein